MISYPISIHPHYRKERGEKKRAGSYIRTHKMFPMAPAIVAEQFLGIHQWMCITLFRPMDVNTTLGISQLIPKVGVYREIVWLGKVKCYPLANDVKIYIPSELWKPKVEVFGEVWRTTAFVQAVRTKRRGVCYLLNIPLLTKAVMIKSQEEGAIISFEQNTPNIPVEGEIF